MKPNCVGKEIHSVGNLIKRQVDNLSSIRYADQLTGTNGWIIDYLYHHQDQDIFQKDIEEIFEVTRSNRFKGDYFNGKERNAHSNYCPSRCEVKKINVNSVSIRNGSDDSQRYSAI